MQKYQTYQKSAVAPLSSECKDVLISEERDTIYVTRIKCVIKYGQRGCKYNIG